MAPDEISYAANDFSFGTHEIGAGRCMAGKKGSVLYEFKRRGE